MAKPHTRLPTAFPTLHRQIFLKIALPLAKSCPSQARPAASSNPEIATASQCRPSPDWQLQPLVDPVSCPVARHASLPLPLLVHFSVTVDASPQLSHSAGCPACALADLRSHPHSRLASLLSFVPVVLLLLLSFCHCLSSRQRLFTHSHFYSRHFLIALGSSPSHLTSRK